ncbi:Transcription elongation factor spt6 [Quillaja saponaria]|uniref:Transcription elongation factor spt6 n=1 Tax=Quillaja saponaria TaxID=32244 RepID=A0AAD7VDZ8_QUISA|nr:Transcription elongation factor spt6 [Quillaja saponaria]
MFENIDRLVAFFQKHIDDPRHNSAPSIRSVAALVPMRSPANGGSSGTSIGSGWGGSTSEGGWGSHSYDRDRSSMPVLRTGRNDYRNNSSRVGHPSRLPQPYGGRGRGRGSNYSSWGSSTGNERQDSGYDAPRWGSVTKDGNDGLSNFPVAKVLNSPGREAFPGSWGTDGGGGGGSSWGGNAGSSWAGAGANDTDAWNSGWVVPPRKVQGSRRLRMDGREIIVVKAAVSEFTPNPTSLGSS